MIGAILMIVLGFFVVTFLIWLLHKAMDIKCKYWEICPDYNADDNVCYSKGGDYYGLGRKAGCYIQMMEKESK